MVGIEAKDDLSDKKTTLSPLEQASLQVERIWRRFTTGEISGDVKDIELLSILDDLERNSPAVFESLTTNGENGKNCLVEIRDRVIPPAVVRGYRVKRR